MNWQHHNIHLKLVNGRQGDPALYCFFSTTGEAILFDLGSLELLSNRELLKIKKVFVSHTHMDHFIGFDRLVRVNVPHFRELELAGPEGFIANVQGKLRGYCWNLLAPDQLRFVIHEISSGGHVRTVRLTNTDSFTVHETCTPQPVLGTNIRPFPEKPCCFVTNLMDRSRIEAVALDHGTPSLAFVCQSPLRFHTNIDELNRRGLKPGAWIKQLQTLLASGSYDTPITIDANTYRAGDLGAEIFDSQIPRSVGYLTDLQFSWPNLKRIKQLMEGVDFLVCEANFASSDYQKAYKKLHLTLNQAMLIAAYIRADEIEVFHISNLYQDLSKYGLDEANQLFNRYRRQNDESLEQLINEEITHTLSQ